ncbi:major facilitator superfamily domain-containing protein [Gloeopeniophorella convolvens]|nr:major facilitator superfamily domain-containing protein [Gloeopeniophorella convolvens]
MLLLTFALARIVPFAMLAALVRGMTLAPRVEVYTQLSCNAHTSLSPIPVHFPQFSNSPEEDDTEDPRQLPSHECLTDPAVQAAAARLQTIMITLMGALSACTTAWWGHFGQKHGRTKVLAVSTFGLFLTDLTFILVSTPSSPLSHHGHKLLLLAPIAEGALGGYATLQAAISAYISDCTSDGSRAHIFSRFAGVSYTGLALGPTLGAFLIRHPLLQAQSTSPQHRGTQSVTTVFWAAIACSLVNFLLAALVIPESMDKARQRVAQKGRSSTPVVQKKPNLKKRLLGPLAIFAPRKRILNGRTQKDWSMSWLAVSTFSLLLGSGIFQIKYLYAEHTFGWGAEQLSYYISFVGGVRALNTLLLMPFIIATFKPAPPPSASSTPASPSSPPPAMLARSISFDLLVARGSFILDIISHSLVAMHLSSSALAFTGATSLASLSSGALPAIHSLAICILQRSRQGSTELGALFGGLSMLTALGQTILGPLMFGIVYSNTVARFPEAIFALAGALVFIALLATFLVRAEPPRGRKGKAPASAVPYRREPLPERERGRSRIVKHVGDRARIAPPISASTSESSASTSDASGSGAGSSSASDAV